MLHWLPNALTCSRLVLALPLGYMILQELYLWALFTGTIAGLTDLLDGFFARKLNAYSRFGAIMDPIADKFLISLTLLCFAEVTLIPWYLALVVIARDLVIVIGAVGYYCLIGPFEFAASLLSKANMFVQISFCVLVLSLQVLPDIPSQLLQAGSIAIVVIALASGIDYVFNWTRKALSTERSS